jgi:hypothetical protein
MIDHVKHVTSWTTMACHVYGFTYCKIITIIICGMQFENIKAQQIIWTKFNHTMLKHMYHEPNFKGFMVDNAQANYNVVKIVYNFGDAIVKMVDKNRTCLFHSTQLLDKYTKQLIKPKLQIQHKALYFEYKVFKRG